MDKFEQKSAPICEALEHFRRRRVVPFDVPGHKRGRGNPELVDLLGKQCVGLDVNSMKPLDNLGHPVSVIRKAEELTADAFGAAHAFLMVNGTTSSVQTMILSVCKAGDKILLPRNVHKSVINALVLCGAIPVYVEAKVNPNHPDKIADRIAGAIVDLAYKQKKDPKIAVEVLIGHGECNIIIECDDNLSLSERVIQRIVNRISESEPKLNLKIVSQDSHLAANQNDMLRCGDNGIFKGCPITHEQKVLTMLASQIYDKYKSDGKYIIDMEHYKAIVCQSNAEDVIKQNLVDKIGTWDLIINPLGDWTGGIDVDSGATNRKLGSDMGDAVTGGGLHGKDLSKADVTVNIYLFIMAQKLNRVMNAYCAIGDEEVMGCPYEKMVKIVREYIKNIGGFEKLAEWGLIRPM